MAHNIFNEAQLSVSYQNQTRMKKILFLLLLPSFAYGQAQKPTTETENIATFCQVWGFLKYHHPYIAQGTIDWDGQFMKNVGTVARMQSKQEISQFYLTWIGALPLKSNTYKAEPKEHAFKTDLGWLNDSTKLSRELRNSLKNLRALERTGQNHYVGFYEGVGNPKFDNEKTYPDSVFPTEAMRLLALARYWNIVEYYFPYKYAIGRDWKEVLPEMIPKFRYPKDTTAYHLAMLELTAKVNDSHANLRTPYTIKYFGEKRVAFDFKIIDKKAVVTRFYSDSLCRLNDIRVGDVFLEVDGRTIADIMTVNTPYVGASNESTRLRNFRNVVFNGNTDSVRVKFDRGGNIHEKKLARFTPETLDRIPPAPRETFKMLSGNIGYVDMGRLTVADVKTMMDQFWDTKAIIFDVRNYPKGTMYLISQRLNPKMRPFVKITTADPLHPGVFAYTPPMYCGLYRNKNFYKGRVVLLFDETSQSHAEFTLMALQTAPKVTSIGSQTAGADGNVSTIFFPGGYKTYITGIGIYYPDGRETQRVGIVPDIQVRPTIAGIRADRDEVLEKALEILH